MTGNSGLNGGIEVGGRDLSDELDRPDGRTDRRTDGRAGGRTHGTVGLISGGDDPK